MGWQAEVKHVKELKESKWELWLLTFDKKSTIPYEGFMNIRFGESSAYFSFDEEELIDAFSRSRKNISCLRMFGNNVHFFWAAFAIGFPVFSPSPIPIYSMKAAHLISLHVGGAIADVFVSWYIYIYVYIYTLWIQTPPEKVLNPPNHTPNTS